MLMMHAYDDVLLNISCEAVGRMLDFSVHSLRMDPDLIMRLFAASPLSPSFEAGDARIAAGMSGTELAYAVLDMSGIEHERRSQRISASLSAEYWSGYALTYLQWQTADTFEEITSVLSIRETTAIYSRLKESLLGRLPFDMSAEKRAAALDAMNPDFLKRVSDYYSMSLGTSSSSPTKLKLLRIKNGLSQSRLSEASGVPLRTIQQYEQRQKDINRARSEYLIRLSKALCCSPDALLERI